MAKQPQRINQLVPPVVTPPAAPSPPLETELLLISSEAIRCKFQCVSVQELPSAIWQQRVYCSPVIGESTDGTPNENTSFAKATPSGVLELLIENEDLNGFFQSGKQFYIDITAIEPEPAGSAI